MGEYRRPHIERMEFRDDDGVVINYGERWAFDEGPPDDSYSVEDHQERFAPLHTVATALIEHLTLNFAVEIEEGSHLALELRAGPSPRDIKRAVRITPLEDGCAPITIILVSGYWVRLHAGVLFTDALPSCTCNACDETWESAADGLESHVLAIAAGGLTETISPPRRAKWGFERGIGFVRGMGQTAYSELRAPDGEWGESSTSPAADLPAALLAEASERLDTLRELNPAGNWLPWPSRASSPEPVIP